MSLVGEEAIPYKTVHEDKLTHTKKYRSSVSICEEDHLLPSNGIPSVPIVKMHRPAIAMALLLVFTVMTLFVDHTSGQVNFTPSWGKRSSQDGCKASMESIMYLYKLIQNEAQKIVDCEKYSN